MTFELNERPLVTVIIPAKNEAAAIADALRAVEVQTYPLERIEVVVVAGDSTDGTCDIAAKVLVDSQFVRWDVLDQPGGTTPSNLNRGLAWAAGKIIVRVDARSLIPVHYIHACVTALSVDGRAVVGGSQVAVERSKHWRDRAIARALNHRFGMGGARYRRVGAQSGPADTVYLGVFHTDELRAAGGWNEHFTTNQDFELNRRMAQFGTVWFEAALPVSYLPRRTHRELAQQYHRFGRWKVDYWRSTADRPQPRQLILIAGPAAVITGAGVVGWLGKGVLIRAVPGAIALGAVAIDGIGGHRSPAPVTVRGLAGATNALIGLSWWTGVIRGMAQQLPSAPLVKSVG